MSKKGNIILAFLQLTMCFGLIHVMFIGPDRINENLSHVKLWTCNNASIPLSLCKQPIDTNMEHL